MKPNDRVRQKSTGDVGVLLSIDDAGLADVVLATGRAFVHVEDLELLPGTPIELLEAGTLGDGYLYALRLQAAYLKHAYKYDTLSGLSNARVEPKLHQVFVAHRATRKLRPRMILADEVGLGKTIEAGLILKELRARELVNRVLVLCPASLQYQWQYELSSKFNEEFEIIDGPAAKYLGQKGENPWTRRDNVITSLPLASRQKRADQIIEADWDLVIFDEAHRVRRRKEGADRTRSTLAYQLADELKEIVDGMLLLTATPMQLHPFELYSLIELVEPGLYPSYESYDRRRQELPALNDLMKSLLSWPALSRDEKEAASQEHYFLLRELGLSLEDPAADLDDKETRERVIEEVTAKHPLAGVLVRNRKVQIGGFQIREPHRYLVPLKADERELYKDVTAYIREGYNRALKAENQAVGFLMVLYQKLLTSSSHALRTSFQNRIAKLESRLKEADDLSKGRPGAAALEEYRDAEESSLALDELEQLATNRVAAEWEIEELRVLVDRLGKIRDSKADVLVNKIVVPTFERDPNEKLLVFTGFIKTQEFLAFALRSAGYRVAIFNGSIPLDEKEAAVRDFKTNAQIMITTEAGGEGRNFQFAHFMVNYDLPWNPMKVEQRIGRLDRIGQKRPVVIYNLANEDTVEEHILDVLEKRIKLFTESVGSLDPILGEVERDLERIVLQHLDRANEEIDVFGVELGQKVEEARLKEDMMRDFILDHASFRQDEANDLLKRTPLAGYNDLARFVSESLGYFGGSLSRHPDGGDSIALSPKLASRLRIRDRVQRGVFDPIEALEHEDLDFYGFGNEVIDKVVDLSYSRDDTTGARAVRGAPAGVSIEVVYRFESQGVRPSGEMRRHLIGPDLVVRSSEIERPPPVGKAVSVEVPPWVSEALAASQRQSAAEHESLRRKVRAEDAINKAEEESRAERVHEYRRHRLEALIEREREWIEDKERFGSDRDRRILPARRGKLQKRVDDLSRLDHDFEQQLGDIRSRRADVTRTVVSAGLVVGP